MEESLLDNNASSPPTTEDLRKATMSALGRCDTISCFSVGREIQEQELSDLERFLSAIDARKQAAISLQCEQDANLALSFCFVVRALIREFQAIIALKDDRPDLAWDHFVNAQSCAQMSMKICADSIDLKSYMVKLDLLERLLFPPQIFMSIGAIIRSSECSICGRVYGECNHLVGRAYMGQVCCEVINQVDRLEEISIVDVPADKRCRVIVFEREGARRDTLTLRIVPEDQDPGPSDEPGYTRSRALILNQDEPFD
jgi:hypothetical protein